MGNEIRRETKTKQKKRPNKRVIALVIVVAVVTTAAAVIGAIAVNNRSGQATAVATTDTTETVGTAATAATTATTSTTATTGTTTAAHVHAYALESVKPEALKSAATCTEAAVYYKSCECGEVGTSETFTVGEALGHKFGEWNVTKQPTTTEEGEQTRTCSVCGESEKEPLALLSLAFKSNRDGTCYVSGIGTCNDKDIVIPYTSPSGDVVTGIVDNAFSYCRGLTSIEIPSSVTSIGSGAFRYCSGLKSIEIPNSVTSIGEDAFYGCSSLTSIEIPNSVTSIGSNAFNGCSSLTSIEIPNSVTSIGNYAFYRCSSLTSIEISNSVTSIGDCAFYECSGLTSIEIPNSVTSIGDHAFYVCSGLTSIEIPNSVTSIGEGAFYNCSSLTSIEIPNSVTGIGRGAFSRCSALTTVYYTGTAEQWNSISISYYSNESLNDATRYYYTETAPTEAGKFWHYVDGVPTVWVHEHSFDVETVKSAALKSAATCTEAAVYYKSCACGEVGTSETFVYGAANGHKFTVETAKSAALKSAATCTEAAVYYKSCECGEVGTSETFVYGAADRHEFTVETAKSAALKSAANCTEAAVYYKSCECGEVGTSETFVYGAANGHSFDVETANNATLKSAANCTEAAVYYKSCECGEVGTSETFTVGEALGHKFGEWVVTKEPSTTEEGEQTRTCLGCGERETKVIPTYPTPSEGLTFTSNGDGTCYVSGMGTCTDTDIVIPYESPDGDMVTSIGLLAFDHCNGITNIVMPDSVTSIAEWAFSGCSGLTSIEIPSNVTNIGYGAFGNCDGLTSITVAPDNTVYYSAENCLIETASKTLIAGCKNSIIPTDGSVTSLSIWAFWGCSGLRSIEIPNSVTSIGEWAFSGCTALTNITVSPGNTVYHSKGNCLIETASKTLIFGCMNSVIPDDGSVTSIGEDAFYRCSSLTSIEIPNSVTSIGKQAFAYCDGLVSVEIQNGVTSIGDSAFGYCTNLTTVYYTGTAEQWNLISIGSSNESLTNATRYYYTETAPTEAGNFWHYVDGVPTVW